MKVVSVEEMRSIDREAIKNLGIPGVVLMDNAAQGVIASIDDYYDFEDIHKATVVCGKGNNGGDGFVVTRYLLDRDIATDVFIVGKTSDIKGDAKINFDVVKGLGIKPKTIRDRKGLKPIRKSLSTSDIIVDAIFGTGFSGQIRGIAAEVVKEINDSNAGVVAVDAPSGIDCNKGAVMGRVVKAQITATMGLPKIGQFLYPARHYIGELYVVDIGFPEQVVHKIDPPGTVVDDQIATRFIPWRAPNLHKGAFGKVLMVAGSTGMTGAAVMAATSALRAGCGLVYLAIPEHLNHILESKCTETITIPVPQTENGSISMDAYHTIMDRAFGVDVMAVGPGMSQHPETQDLIRKLIEKTNIPVVIDADGINAIEGNTDLLKKRKQPTIVTPHPGEMSRLIDISAGDIVSNKINICCKYAKKWGIILVLKGAPTVIAKQDGTFWVNPYLNSGLATGGSGDVLTGLVTGFLAQKTTPAGAAVGGVFIHSQAGEIVREHMGEYSMIASDLIDAIPQAITEIIGK